MAVFEYKALTEAGKTVTGIIDADSDREARSKLRKKSVYATDLKVSEEGISLKSDLTLSKLLQRFSLKDLAVTTRQLSTLIKAGIPVIQALTAIIDQLEASPLRKIIIQVKETVNSGGTLADALAEHPKAFSELYVNMVRAGESAGALELILGRLADYNEKSLALRNKVRAALVYPIAMSVIGTLVVVFLMVKIVPNMVNIFIDIEQSLPAPTRALIAISNFLQSYWWVLLLVFMLLYFLKKRIGATAKGKYFFDKVKLNLPLLGQTARKMAVSRFTRTLSILTASGIPILRALDIVRNVVNNAVLADAIEKSREAVRHGDSIAEPLRRSKVFPPIVIHMIAIGEASGKLEEMLTSVAESYDSEVDATVSGLTALIEPIMIIVMGAIVMFIVLSIMLPIFQMNMSIG
ncbi:MAG: type II secretion system inner membrane protein GspF [Candidatus Tritonobacter lacicola]|nr:type II secretion system inner membrane protein GspF [Candidatus Tritonobacter lacicola]